MASRLLYTFGAGPAEYAVCSGWGVKQRAGRVDEPDMRIALDARTVYGPQRRGIGKTLRELYAHLVAARPQWQITAFHRSPRPCDAFAGDSIRPRAVDMIGDRFDAWQRWRLPLAAWRDGGDVMHCPANFCPAWMPLPGIVTIHDLIPLELPEGRPAAELRRFEQSVRQACRGAAWVVTPSHDTRQKLIKHFDADPQRTSVVPWAADSQLTGHDAALDLGRYHGLMDRLRMGAPYVLHMGATEPRKNTRRVIEAWAMLKPSVRRNWKLLVVGLDPAGVEMMRRCVSRLRCGPSVVLCGYVDDEDVRALLHAAVVLAYPSLMEGFGLPVLDAFATDTAVLTARSGAIPEVAGDAVHYTDPTDACAISKSLGRLMTEPSYRHHLVQAGRWRLSSFTWPGAAEAFAQVVERVAAVSPRQRAAA